MGGEIEYEERPKLGGQGGVVTLSVGRMSSVTVLELTELDIVVWGLVSESGARNCTGRLIL